MNATGGCFLKPGGSPGGRVSVFDKLLPAKQPPGLARHSLNRVVRFLISDINRSAEPLIAATTWRIQCDEFAGFCGVFPRINTMKKKNMTAATTNTGRPIRGPRAVSLLPQRSL